MTHGNRLDSGERRLGRGTGGAEYPRQPRLECGLGEREHPAHGSQASVERELAHRRVLRERIAGDLAGRSQNRQCDRQVERRALFPQGRRSEIDRYPSQRPLELGRSDSASHAMLRFLARAVGEPDDGEPGQAVLEMRLDLDSASLETDERVRDGAREHTLHARRRGVTCL